MDRFFQIWDQLEARPLSFHGENWLFFVTTKGRGMGLTAFVRLARDREPISQDEI